MTTNGHLTIFIDRDGKSIDQQVMFQPPIILGMVVKRCHIYKRAISNRETKEVHPEGRVIDVKQIYG